MTFTEKKAEAIAAKHGLSPVTVRIWRLRGKIPARYAEKEDRVLLSEILPDEKLTSAVEKYGVEMQRLLETRQFKPGQTDSYYMTCLFSLCSECEKMNK